MLVGLGLGKLAMVLGGAGQGNYSNSPLATAYTGPGPWISANPDYPALPSQALEGGLAILTAALLVGVPFLLRLRLQRRRLIVWPCLAPDRGWVLLTGPRRFAVALLLWAEVRFAMAETWRDATVLGPLRAEQLILLGLIAGCLAVIVAPDLVRFGRGRRAARKARDASRWSALDSGVASAAFDLARADDPAIGPAETEPASDTAEP
jgi:hypothetical protein